MTGKGGAFPSLIPFPFLIPVVLAHPDIEKRDVDTVGENERVGRIGRIALKHMHYHMQKRSLRGSCWKAQEAQPGAL